MTMGRDTEDKRWRTRVNAVDFALGGIPERTESASRKRRSWKSIHVIILVLVGVALIGHGAAISAAPICAINITSDPSHGALVYIYDVTDSTYFVNGEDVDSYNNSVACNHTYNVWVEKEGARYDVKIIPSDWSTTGNGQIAVGVADATEPIHFELACTNPTVDAGSDTQICAGDTASLSGTATNYSSVLWSTSGSGSFASPSSLSTTYDPSPGDIAAGTVTLTLTAYAESPCVGQASDDLVLTIVALPIATAANSGPVCVGDPLTLTGGPSGMSSYAWTGPDGFTSTEQSPTVSNSATPAMAGTYSLTVINDSGCASSAAATTDVVVNERPVATAANSGPVCVGDPLTLTGGPSGMSSYAWTGPDGFTSTEQSPTVSNSATSAMAGTYSLIVINDSGCASSAAATTDVQVNACETQPVAVTLHLQTCALGTGADPEHEWLTFSVPLRDRDAGAAHDEMIRLPANEISVQYGSVWTDPSSISYGADRARVTFTYVPPLDFVGTDTIRFTAYDADGEATPGTVTIDVGDCRSGQGDLTDHAVVINEVAWAGTEYSPEDEWIELYNMSSGPKGETVDLSGWILAWRHRLTDSQAVPHRITDLSDFRMACTGSPCWEIALSGKVDPGNYYLLERHVDSVVSDIRADLVYDPDGNPYNPNGYRLSDSIGEEIYLFDKTGSLVSSANTDYTTRHPGGAPWPAGSRFGGTEYASMERIRPTAERYDVDEDWSTNKGVIIFGLDAGDDVLTATAKSLNEAFVIAQLEEGGLPWVTVQQGETLTLTFSLRDWPPSTDQFPRATVLSAAPVGEGGGTIVADAVLDVRRIDQTGELPPDYIVEVDLSQLNPGQYWVFLTAGSGVFHCVAVQVNASS